MALMQGVLLNECVTMTFYQGGKSRLLHFRSTEVLRSTKKYQEVRRSIKKYQEVPRSIEKYLEVPRSTNEVTYASVKSLFSSNLVDYR